MEGLSTHLMGRGKRDVQAGKEGELCECSEDNGVKSVKMKDGEN